MPALARDRSVLAALTALAAVLRVPTLGVQSYWGDEAATVAVLRAPLDGLYDAVADSESTPPLYYLLAWPWTRLFGDEEFALRLLSALFAVATVPVLALAGARLAGRRGLWAGGLVAACNPLLQWFGQEARAYALLALLVACATLALLHVAERPTIRWALLWGLAAAGAIATHWFAIFAVAPQAVWLLAVARRDRRAVAAALGPPLVAGLALLPLLLDQREADRASFIRDESLPSRVVALVKQWVVGYDAPGELVLGVLAAVIVVAAVAALVRAPAARARGLALVLAASLALPLLAAAAGDDYVLTRNLLASLVIAVPLLAAGLAALPAAAAPALGAIWVAAIAGVALDDGSQREDWRTVADRLGPPRVARIVAIVPGSGRVGAQHYLRDARVFTTPVTVREIDVVGMATGGTGERRSVPEIPLDRPIWPGFRLRAVHREAGHVVARWTAAPTRVEPLVLGAVLPGSTLLLQRP